MIYYLRSPELDQPTLISNYRKSKRGLFFFFRHMCIAMQAHFSDLMDLNQVPKVFLHGNPHIENYSITFDGAGMVDFDRSRIGPYSWDILRFLSSLSLKRVEKNSPFLSSVVLDYFKEGYHRGIYNPKLPFKTISQAINKANLNVWYDDTGDYLENNGKWYQEMKKDPIEPDNKELIKKLTKYLETTDEPELLNDYQVANAGRAAGTFGNQRIIILLESKNKVQEPILLEIKETYADEDTEHFYNPEDHHGKRMINASELYSPGVEKRIGYLRFKGKDYWGRQIITKHGKIKESLDEFEQVDVAFSVASQLGRAHRLSLDPTIKAKTLANHFFENFDNIIGNAVLIISDLIAAYDTYMDRLKRMEKK